MSKRGKRGLSKSVKVWLIKSYGGKCQYCGKPGDTLDHIIPLSKGGARGSTNVTLACQDCNNEKGNRLDYITEERQAYLLEQAEFRVVQMDLLRHLRGRLNRKLRNGETE